MAYRIANRWALALLVAGMIGTAEDASAILVDRGPDMVYDTVLDITWTRQAGDGVRRQWTVATQWAADLVFGGFDDWRLPYASVSAGAGPITGLANNAAPCTGAGGADEVACRDNEMAYMYYYNLGGSFFGDETGTQTAVGGEQLTGIQNAYWSGTQHLDVPGTIPFSVRAYLFVFGPINGGTQHIDDKAEVALWAWAVRDGDVGAVGVPEPASLLLLGLGALGLGWASRRRR